MKNITLGQYYPSDSLLHKADPRIKLIMALFLIITSFLCKSIISFAALIVIVIILVIVSKIPVRVILRAIRPILIIMTVTMIINIFWTKGDDLL